MTTLQHKFVDNIPESIEEGVLYISIPYDMVIHKCCCGCGNEVVTPLLPSQWSFTYDGETISIRPSIGNWSFKCQSHYYIKEGRVIWSKHYNEQEIRQVREADFADNARLLEETNQNKHKGLLSRLFSFWK